MLFFLLLPFLAFAHQNDLPPRLQWVENGGYCGEVSFITAGLFYGQYASQYDVRGLVGDQLTELLIGYNDEEAARKMHLNYIPWSGDGSAEQFLSWVKTQVLQGYPTIIGIYMNEYLFYGNPDPFAGCIDYDHIVPVVGITENKIHFTDDGLWDGDGNPPYFFSYSLTSFPGGRKKANRKHGEIYTLPNDVRNYGIAITGVTDLLKETLPIRLETSINYEIPTIVEGSETRPNAIPLELTINVFNVEPHVPYVLYRYNSFESVPDSNFNGNAHQAYEIILFEIESGAIYSLKHAIDSDEIAIYRAVKR
jgi:hypothetical protein